MDNMMCDTDRFNIDSYSAGSTAPTSRAVNANHTGAVESYMSSATVNDDIKAAKSSALRLLARREYSRLELFRKLTAKFSSADAVQDVLDQLRDQGYQSDDRFTESFIRSKVSSGNGPFKIKIALREKGVCESTVLSVFDRLGIDWFEVVDRVALKRFGCSQGGAEDIDINEKAKRIRYLKSRGFYQEHIDEVMYRYSR